MLFSAYLDGCLVHDFVNCRLSFSASYPSDKTHSAWFCQCQVIFETLVMHVSFACKSHLALVSPQTSIYTQRTYNNARNNDL